LADRVGALVEDGSFPLVLGGDCSILLGSMLALKRRGRFGLAFFDAHSDFRHPGKAAPIEAAAGEDLALVIGLGDERLTDLDGLGASVRRQDVVLLGVRDADPDLAEIRALGMNAYTASDIVNACSDSIAAQALSRLEHASLDGFWIHCDLDVVDGAVLPAVDSPEPEGLDYVTLAALLRALSGSPKAIGAQITIFDPDLDPAGRHAAAIADCLVAAFAPRG
jgi:arginase